MASEIGLPAKDCCAAASASADVKIDAAGVRVSSLGASKALLCIAVSSAIESDGFTAVVHEIGYVPFVIVDRKSVV